MNWSITLLMHGPILAFREQILQMALRIPLKLDFLALTLLNSSLIAKLQILVHFLTMILLMDGLLERLPLSQATLNSDKASV